MNGILRSLDFIPQQSEDFSSFRAGERCVFACYPEGAKDLPRRLLSGRIGFHSFDSNQETCLFFPLWRDVCVGALHSCSNMLPIKRIKPHPNKSRRKIEQMYADPAELNATGPTDRT